MKRFFQILPLVMIISLFFVLIYNGVLTGSDKPVTEEQIITLENSIIINDIRMESAEPPADETEEAEDGRIIYDDGIKYREIDTLKGIDQKELKILKKSDPRWHLTKYRIKKNDNLWTIAKKFNVDHNLIVKINYITNPEKLMPGKAIEVPNRNGIFVKINKNDTISSIAKKYSVKGNSITSHNGITGSKLISGEKIFVPDAVVKKDVRDMWHNPASISKKREPVHQQKPSLVFSWPIRGKITSGFGNRRDPFSGERKFHCGIDISANQGTPVHASASGRVIFSGWKDGYGNVVIMRHDGGYITVYAHNSKNTVSEKDYVKKGKLIALSGMTGAVTGGHVHFEIRKYVTPLNPLRMIK